MGELIDEESVIAIEALVQLSDAQLAGDADQVLAIVRSLTIEQTQAVLVLLLGFAAAGWQMHRLKDRP